VGNNENMLTQAEIKSDIDAYRDRIRKAKAHLEMLPSEADTFAQRKKIKPKRHHLETEIVHVQSLIKIAESAL